MNNAPTTSGLTSAPVSPPGPSDSSHDIALPYPPTPTHQQRLLRLRNDRFPAKSLFPRRTSSMNPGDRSPPSNQENIAFAKPRAGIKHRHTTSSLGILAEISNSVRTASLGVHNKELSKRQGIPIFEDTPERALLDASPYTSPPIYRNASSSPVESPFRFGNIQDSLNMGLREVSGNARKTPPDNSPRSPATKSVRRRQATLSKFNSEEYIDRIEQELELANNSVYSPNSNKPWKDKLKSSEAENERLRRELAEVRATFEAEVQNAVQHKTAAEVVLRRKIRSLEDEVEQKAAALRDMETQHDEKRLDQGTVETLKATIERLEAENISLEQSNHSMSKRNEVLTHLLAVSPTKPQHISELDTSARASRAHRPHSLLLPRISSSPTHTHPQRPRSLIGSPASSNGFDQSPRTYLPSSPLQMDSQSRSYFRPDLIRSHSSQTGGRSHSRSSTLASCVSQSPTSSDHPSTSSSAEPGHRRRTRRMNGSTQLKPLLLPRLTGEFGGLTTSPVTSPTRIARRDFTDESVDPTKMFISQPPAGYDSDTENPLVDPYVDLLNRQNARQMAYQSLEGVLDANNTSRSASIASIEDGPGSGSPGLTAIDIRDRRRSLHALVALRSPQSISSGEDADRTLLPASYAPSSVDVCPEDGEDNNQLVLYSTPDRDDVVEVPEPLFSPSARARQSFIMPSSPLLGLHDDIDNHGLPVSTEISRKRRKMSASSRDSTIERELHRAAASLRPTVVDKGIDASSDGMETPIMRSRPTSMSLLSPRRSRTPLEILQRKNFGVRPIAVVTIKTIYGTLSKCTQVMRDFKTDPLALARRVIANAWRCNWAVLGKLSWWVLGLFLGPSTKQQKKPQTWDWDDYDGEAIADRHCFRDSKRFSAIHEPLLKTQNEATPERRVRFDSVEEPATRHEPKSPPQRNEKAGWGKTVLLWGKFSMAIMLAVGGAVVKGPGEMLKESDMKSASSKSRDYRRVSTSSDDSEVSEASAVSVEMLPISPSSDTSELRRRRPPKPTLCSPPPSARALLAQELDGTILSSSPPASSSPSVGSFRFGRGQPFDFDMTDSNTIDADTLKPRKPPRTRIDQFFEDPPSLTPSKGQRGRQEYDPESAGLGIFRSTASTPDSLKGPGGGWYG